MLHYPKIPGSRDCPPGRYLAFEKYDGTNLHWDWDRELGWHSFGPRRGEYELTEAGIEQFSNEHIELVEAAPLFLASLAADIEQVLRDHSSYRSIERVKAFTEFFGPGSFAGKHKNDDPKELRLFDVWLEPTGIIGPKEFVADFGHLRIARVVYDGKFTGKFAEDVRQGNYNVNEGVVCKRGLGGDDLVMCKIKTNAYLERLRAAFADDWEAYWE